MMLKKNDGIALEGTRKITRIGKASAEAVIAIVSGLMAARAGIYGGLVPFGIAAVAAAPQGDGIFILLGAVLGYLLPHGSQNAARYIAAAIAVFIIRILFSDSAKKHRLFSPLLAAVICGLTGIAAAVTSGAGTRDIVFCAAETVICGCAAEFFGRAFPLLKNPAKLWGLEHYDYVSVTITFCVGLLALSGIRAGNISLGRIIGVLAVLIAARYGSEAGGSITGSAAGLILGLGDKNMAFLLAGYAFGGLMAGVFSPLGRFGCAAAFILANAAAGINGGISTPYFYGLVEVAVATMLFMIIPEKYLYRLSAALVPAGNIVRSTRDASDKLDGASKALRYVSDTVAQIGDKLQKIGNGSITEVFDSAADQTCRRCAECMYCWGTAYNDTMDAFNHVTETLNKNRRITKDDLPAHFSSRCCRLGELVDSINQNCSSYLTRIRARSETAQLRGILVDDLNGMAEFLGSLGGRIAGAFCAENEGGGVKAALVSCGLNVENAVCSIDELGHMSIWAKIGNSGKTAVNRAELQNELSSACGVDFDGPAIDGDAGSIVMRFTQKPTLKIRMGKSVVRKDGESLCGDTADAFIQENRAVMILCDGMGCGGEAAVISSLTVELMSHLLRAGFGPDSAVKIVNSALMLKSGDESFSTIDITFLDLFTGQAEFAKAGAPPTFIRRFGRVERISESSIPVGILRGTKLQKASARLHSGDLIVMVSDGALCGKDGWLIEAIEHYSGDSPENFAQDITKKAKENRNDGHGDDITAMVAMIQ